MKNKTLLVFPLLLGSALSLSQVAHAQTLSAELTNTAKEACKKSAVDKGFKVENIVSVTPKGTDGANVVLTLSKDGHPAKLTCGYSKTAGAAIGEDKVATATTTTPSPVVETKTEEHKGFPWKWLLLLPLLAIPFLFLGKKERPVAASYDTDLDVREYHGLVETDGNRVDIHAQPNSSSMVIGHLDHGQSVLLSGNHDNDWTQLKDGGWIPSRHVRRQVV
jgi:hypothetical protein